MTISIWVIIEFLIKVFAAFIAWLLIGLIFAKIADSHAENILEKIISIIATVCVWVSLPVVFFFVFKYIHITF